MRNFKLRPKRTADSPIFRASNSIGGSKLSVQKKSENAGDKAAQNDIPDIAALIYHPPSVVNTDQDVLEQSTPLTAAESIYVPVNKIGEEQARPIAEKFKNWFFKGVWA